MHKFGLILFLWFVLNPPASAAVYKCMVNGKSVFQDMPCDGNGSQISVKPNGGVDKAALKKQMTDSGKKMRTIGDSISAARSKRPMDEAHIDSLIVQWEAEQKKFKDAQRALIGK